MFANSEVQPRLVDKYRQARQLRRSGIPIKRIAARLGVSSSTVHRWTRDVELTPEQVETIRKGWERGVERRGRKWAERCRERRRRYQAIGRAQAKLGDPLHLAGCMLYWAEGAKSRNTLMLANSDPQLLRMYVRFLRESLRVESEAITLRLNVYLDNDLPLGEIEEYWLSLLQLPKSALRAHTIDHLPTSSSGRKPNKLRYGVCSVKVNSTELVQHVFGAIQEYGGFEQPAWLDGPPRKNARA